MTKIVFDLTPAQSRAVKPLFDELERMNEVALLLADWPAVLAPVAPKGAVADARDFPSGSGY